MEALQALIAAVKKMIDALKAILAILDIELPSFELNLPF